MSLRTTQPAYLSESEVACLEAIRSGADTKTRVALRARLDLKQTESTLRRLSCAGIIEKCERTWVLTPRGITAVISVAPNPERRRGGKRQGEVRSGTSAHRLLALLARPQHGTKIVAELGVTPQRLHQLVVRLAALGLVRIGDLERPLHVVARSDDRSCLLRVSEEKVFSAIPDTAGTTIAKIATASRQSLAETASVIGLLIDEGLAEVAGHSRHGDLYKLTSAGREHWQRRPLGRTADLPALPVRSHRVQMVLAHLAQHGPTRTQRIGHALGIPRASMNALMQYLKRKGLVRKSGEQLTAPYELTSEGQETLEAMLK